MTSIWYHSIGLTLPREVNLFVNPGLESYHRILQQPCPPSQPSGHRNTREAHTDSALRFETIATKRPSAAPDTTDAPQNSSATTTTMSSQASVRADPSPVAQVTRAAQPIGTILSSQSPVRPDPALIAHVTRFESTVPRRPAQIRCNHWHENMKFFDKVYTEGHNRNF